VCQLLLRAKDEKQMKGHDVIDKALNSLNSSDKNLCDFELMTLTGELLFRPTKQTSTKKIDFLSTAEVLVSHDPRDKYVGFRGLQQKSDISTDVTAGGNRSSASSSDSNNDPIHIITIATTSPPSTPPPRRQMTSSNAPILYNLDASNVGSPPSIPPPRSIAHN
jgi:hypothetical protein